MPIPFFKFNFDKIKKHFYSLFLYYREMRKKNWENFYLDLDSLDSQYKLEIE